MPTFSIYYTIFYLNQILLLLGNTGINVSPKKLSVIKFCQWNLNRLAAQENQNFDKKCLSKTLLDSTVPINGENITMNWYSLLKADHPDEEVVACIPWSFGH